MLSCNAGVFFRRANVFARESAMLKLQKRGGNGASQRVKVPGYYFYSHQSFPVIKSKMVAWLQQYEHKQAAFARPKYACLN